MKYIYLTTIFLFFTAGLLGQGTYSLFLEDSLSKFAYKACESSDNRINVIIAERTGHDYGFHELIRGYMLIFDSNGDTVVKNYIFGDTIFSFDCITEIEDGFIVAGIFKSPGDSIYGLLICKLDINRDIVWSKMIRNSAYNRYSIQEIFSVNNEYILCGSVCVGLLSHGSPYLIKLDENGNFLTETVFPGMAVYAYTYVLTPDSSNIWLIVPAGLQPIPNSPTISVYDLNLNYLGMETFFNGFVSRLSVKWFSPDIFLLSSSNEHPEQRGADDIFLYKIDTSYNIIQWNNFGTVDSSEVTAMRHSIDFENQDSIFFAGYKNNTIGIPWPQEVDWIMIGQVDSTLQPRFVNYIGGDAYYETNYILATKDGGVFICAGKFSHEKQLYDLLFLKLNNQGLLVNNKSTDIMILHSNISPNPATDQIVIRSVKLGEKVEIIDLNGKLMHSIHTNSFPAHIDISTLERGIYLVRITFKDGQIENHKFLKI